MLTLRRAKEEDRKFLAEVCEDAALQYNSIFPGAFGKQAKKFIDEGLPRNYEIEVIEDTNLLIGFVGYVKLDQNTLYLTALYILSKHQRRGYGDRVLNLMEERLKEEAIISILLLVHQEAYWAIDFYKKQGFQIVSQNLEEIKAYHLNLEKYYIPSTILMKMDFKRDRQIDVG